MSEEDLKVEVDWQPFQLDPSTPDKGVSIHESLGIDPKRLEATHRYLKQRADELGLDFNPSSIKVNTRKAHLLAEYARSKNKFDPLRRALFAAYFVRGENLADDQVLTEILESVDMDSEAALQAVQDGLYDETLRLATWQAQSFGIRGVPAFVIENKYLISGAQPYDQMVEALRSIQAESKASENQ